MLMFNCFVMLPAVRELGFQKVKMVTETEKKVKGEKTASGTSVLEIRR